MSYTKTLLDLGTVTSGRVQIVPPGARIAEVFALTVPDGASFGLAFGNADALDIDKPFSFAPTQDSEQTMGLFYVNTAAQPGVSVAVYVGYVDGSGGGG